MLLVSYYGIGSRNARASLIRFCSVPVSFGGRNLLTTLDYDVSQCLASLPALSFGLEIMRWVNLLIPVFLQIISVIPTATVFSYRGWLLPNLPGVSPPVDNAMG